MGAVGGGDEMRKLLLHCCCGPCSTAVVERLRERYDVSLYWFNPNIQPQEEYQRRLAAMKALARELEMPLLIEEGGEHEWEDAIVGREDQEEGGDRCDACYLLRLRHAAAKAKELDCGFVAATLSISPHKDAKRISAAGHAATKGLAADFVAEDFKAHGGFERSVELARALGLYRQKYCGCRFSRR